MSIFAERKAGTLTGNLVVEVRVGDKIVRRRVKTKREAIKVEAQLKSGLVAAAAPAKPLTVAEMIPQVETLWHGTKDERNSLRKLHKAFEVIGHKTLVKDINGSSLASLQDSLRSSGLSDPTINRYNAVVSKALEWCHQNDHIPKVPVIQWYKEPLRKFSWLEPSDERRVLAWIAEHGPQETGPRVATVIRILTLTGMRIGELIKVEVDHIDPEGETVTAWDTKTGDNRTQYLPRELADALKEMKVLGSFPHYRTIGRIFYKARDALGLDPKLTIHGLRHTTATRLAGQGVNQKVIMDYMGHKSMATTNRYTHVNAAAKKGVAQVLLGMTGVVE